ncbi:unnamed protein product [Enterobius vermicularis]|uniref:CUB domain-containing protein n=1 Tax=Enterobius vermicularis TaxID=51028 RepID=A0A0N4V785_ENTVE|nr:unnamed protein product [Enterobius vermicularis]
MHGCGPHNKKMIIAESFDFAADEALQEKESGVCKYRSLPDGTDEKLVARGKTASIISLPAGVIQRSFITDFEINDVGLFLAIRRISVFGSAA